MRIHYAIIATDYYMELCERGVRGRQKAGAFLMYAMDGELGNFHTVRFYAQAWNRSISTVHAWLQDFDRELDRFEAARALKRADQKRYAKNQTEQTEHPKPNKPNTIKHQLHRKQQQPTEQTEQPKPNEDILIYDDDARDGNVRKKLFDDLYMIYRINTKNAGSKESAYEAYKNLRGISHKTLVTTIVLYLHDASVERKYNLANFLKNEIYLSYIPNRIKVSVDGDVITGAYDSDRGVFTSDNGTEYALPSTRLAEKLAAGELEFIVDEEVA